MIGVGSREYPGPSIRMKGLGIPSEAQESYPFPWSHDLGALLLDGGRVSSEPPRGENLKAAQPCRFMITRQSMRWIYVSSTAQALGAGGESGAWWSVVCGLVRMELCDGAVEWWWHRRRRRRRRRAWWRRSVGRPGGGGGGVTVGDDGVGQECRAAAPPAPSHAGCTCSCAPEPSAAESVRGEAKRMGRTNELVNGRSA